MFMKRFISFCAAVIFLSATLSWSIVPAGWDSRGVGGGGALFSPSINPADDKEFYVACDMSELFHTVDYGASFSIEPFYRIVAANYSLVCFTSNPLVRYCISYANDLVVPVKSADGGNTWNKMAGNPDESETTYGIFVDYDHPDRVVMSYYGNIYFSQNGGTTFTSIHTAKTSGSGCVLAGAFFTGDSIFLGTSDGLIISSDAGQNFSMPQVGGIPSTQVIFSFAGAKQGSVIRLFCLTGNASDVYAGITGNDYWGFMQGVYSIEWGNGNWTEKMTGIQKDADYPMYLAMPRNNTNIAYLAGSSDAGEPNVLKTTDAGANWKRVFITQNNQNIATGWSGAGGDHGWGYGECIYGISVAAQNPDKAVISDMGFVHKTSDGGATWQQSYVSRADQHAAGAATPKRAYYHGIGLENTSCWQVFWADSLNMFAAFTDMGGVRSANAGVSWSFDYSGHTANTMYRIVQAPDKTLYAATSGIHDLYQSTRLGDAQLNANDNEGKIIFSTDKAVTWKVLHTFNHPVFWVELDPNDPKKMYASVVHSSQGGIFVSTDIQNGATSAWTKLAAPPRTQGHPASIVALKDSAIVCTYSGRRDSTGAFTNSSGAFMYKPSSGVWTDVSDAGMYYWTKDIVVDRSDATQNTWYAGVYSGWGGKPNGLGGLYKTTNRGGAWKRISDLDRVGSITINPGDAAEAYLTTETAGLWHTSNLNTPAPVFSRVDSYPFGHPERVCYNPFKQSEIWVTSMGNGMRMGSTGSAGTSGNRGAGKTCPRLSVRYCAGKIFVEGDFRLKEDNEIMMTSLDGRTIFRQKISYKTATGPMIVNVGRLKPDVCIFSVNGSNARKIVVIR
jgi:photosystem II stability/assembly factor-like uncharacterized protein